MQKLMKAYRLWQNYLVNFPRTSRYTLGLRTDSVFIETVELIFAAAHERERESKIAFLGKATQKLDLLKFLLNLLWEIKALDNKKYINLSKELYEIGRMLGGWEKSLKNHS